MPVNFLNLPGLRVLDFKELDREPTGGASQGAVSLPLAQ